jgi:fucose 4-O-acetylase-like acetyltransferase
MSAATTPPPPATGSVRTSSGKRRVPFWDNARFACIVLVVLGHAIQRLTYDSDIALGLYLLVYAFHMPAFALISGYFSKSDPPGRRQMVRVLTDIVLPYLVFEGLWTITKLLVEGQANPNITQPSWTLWFLLALAIFRLVLPYLALLRWPLLWTMVISIGVGYVPNIDSTFSLSRTLGLLPFFTLG